MSDPERGPATAEEALRGPLVEEQTIVDEELLSKILRRAQRKKDLLPFDGEEEKRVWNMANRAVQGGFVKPLKNERDHDQIVNRAFSAMLFGAELGISPQQALANVAVVNGRPSLMNKIKLGLCLKKVKFDRIPAPKKFGMEFVADEKRAEDCKVVWTCKRDGVEFEGEFSMADARRGKLYPNAEEAAWQKYPKDQLLMRALGRLLDIACADVLMGADSAEDLTDIERFEKLKDMPPPPEPLREMLEEEKKCDSSNAAVAENQQSQSQAITNASTVKSSSSKTAARSESTGATTNQQKTHESSEAGGGRTAPSAAPESPAQKKRPPGELSIDLPPQTEKPPKTAKEMRDRKAEQARGKAILENGPVGLPDDFENGELPEPKTKLQEEAEVNRQKNLEEDWPVWLILQERLSPAQRADVKQQMLNQQCRGVYVNMPNHLLRQAVARAKSLLGAPLVRKLLE